ncbi:MAG: hypothetical protein WBK91_10420 [Alphaproteobacteria bacterium]
MVLRRHMFMALIAAGLSAGGTPGMAAAPESLENILATVQEESAAVRAQQDTPAPAGVPVAATPAVLDRGSAPAAPVSAAPTSPAPASAAPASAAVPVAAPANLPPVVAEPPRVFAPPAAPATTTFQFLPLLPSASDMSAIPALWPLLSSQDLGASHDSITRAVIILHNTDRNAATALARLQKLAGAVASGPEARTMILAPLFPTETERPVFKAALGAAARDLTTWPADEWAYGGSSLVSEPRRPVSSMLALDVLLLYLADQKSFPSLRTVVIAGAGSGGDMVQRYALYGRAPDILAGQQLTLRFVVAAAQSYAYLTETRPRADGGFAPPSEAAQKDCATWHDYPYGTDVPNSYTRQTATDTVRQNFPARDVVFLYGAQDTQPAQDQNCAAKLQGASVKARAENYESYVQSIFPDAQGLRFVALAGVGGGDKIWGSTCGISVLFADGDCVKN